MNPSLEMYNTIIQDHDYQVDGEKPPHHFRPCNFNMGQGILDEKMKRVATLVFGKRQRSPCSPIPRGDEKGPPVPY